MKLDPNNIKRYSEELSYLTDLKICVYSNGCCCSLYSKVCSGIKDGTSDAENCKDFKTIGDVFIEKNTPVHISNTKKGD